MEKLKTYFKNSPEILSLIMFFLVGATIVLFTNAFSSVVAPFVIAYIVARLLRPIMVFLKNKIKTPRIINAVICLVVFVSIAAVVIWLAVCYISEGISYLVDALSSKETVNEIINFATDVGVKLKEIMSFLNIEIRSDEIASIVGSLISKIVPVLSNFTINAAIQVPNLLLSAVICIMTTFYITYDYDKLADAINRQLSPKVKKTVDIFNTQVLLSFLKMIFSYVIISSICFIELLIGFWVLGIKNATLVALIIAILDVLPVLGSAIILVPWGILMIAFNKPFIGLGLLVLCGIIEVVRQILEPKIVGSQIGLHPLITIASLFIGVRLMGGVGLIVLPLYIILCKKLNEEGIIKLYKTNNGVSNKKNDGGESKENDADLTQNISKEN